MFSNKINESSVIHDKIVRVLINREILPGSTKNEKLYMAICFKQDKGFLNFPFASVHWSEKNCSSRP